VAQRDRLKEALRFVRRGDTLAVTKPDRLARSTTDLLRIVEDLERRGVGLVMRNRPACHAFYNGTVSS
jgi:DNA invertase Pin-like site-specific DNA recombinase